MRRTYFEMTNFIYFFLQISQDKKKLIHCLIPHKKQEIVYDKYIILHYKIKYWDHETINQSRSRTQEKGTMKYKFLKCF